MLACPVMWYEHFKKKKKNLSKVKNSYYYTTGGFDQIGLKWVDTFSLHRVWQNQVVRYSG